MATEIYFVLLYQTPDPDGDPVSPEPEIIQLFSTSKVLEFIGEHKDDKIAVYTGECVLDWT
jgi:hypothetical protein